MMIDNAIYEVFHQDKKVFIPEFGAIIYSEFNDSIDFNDLLTFDDGKVITEIQKQQRVSAEEASNALNEYVQNIRDTLEKGEIHFFGGIGYLSKDENGSFSISKSSPDSLKGEEIIDQQSDDLSDNQETEEKSKSIPTSQQEEKTHEEEEETETLGSEEDEETNEEKTNIGVAETQVANEEQDDDIDQSNDSLQTEENEYIHEFDKEESKDKNRKVKPILIALGIIALIIAIASSAYYFITKNDRSNAEFQKPLISSLESTEDLKTNKPGQVLSTTEKAETENKVDNNTPAKSDAVAESKEQTNTVDLSTSTNPEAGQNKIYSLILGSFKVENNADKFELMLNEKGIDVSKFRRSNSFYFVGIEQIKGKSNAVELLAKLREEEEPTAWIIKKL